MNTNFELPPTDRLCSASSPLTLICTFRTMMRRSNTAVLQNVPLALLLRIAILCCCTLTSAAWTTSSWLPVLHASSGSLISSSLSQNIPVLSCNGISTSKRRNFCLEAAKYQGGAGVGRLVLDDDVTAATAATAAVVETLWQTHYDMVLCERLQVRVEERASGLFVPQDDLPKLNLCRVLSVGRPGREEENGRITAMPAELIPGAIVIAKNPWGIGPKDEETTDGRKLSYMRMHDICAVVTGGIIDKN